MTKIKGYKKLNKVVSAPLKQFGIKKAVCGDIYCYCFDSEKIYFKLTVDREDRLFNEFVKERFNYDVKEYGFIISLLHEVGHHKNNDDVDGDVYDFCLKEKNRIETEIKNATRLKYKKLQCQYFNLPDEIMATAWAVNYAKKHPKKIKKMWHKIQPAILKFYTKNKITDD